MTVKYGFYNAVNGDRSYDANDMSALFEGVFHDGVFFDIGNAMGITESTGMGVTVLPGKAWFNKTWTEVEEAFRIPLDDAHAVFGRIDIVTLEIDKSDLVRANTIKIIKGTPSGSPVAPTLTNSGTLHQYPLAHIVVGANVTSILTANITNKMGTVDCPWVKGVLPNIDTVAIDEALAEVDADISTVNGLISDLNNEILDFNSTVNTLGKYVVSTYSAPNYAVTIPGVSTLTAGMIVRLKAANHNRPSTSGVQNQESLHTYINVNSLGNVEIHLDGYTLPFGAFRKNCFYSIVYDGTYWNLISPSSLSIQSWRAVTHYVSPTLGNDATADGTIGLPFSTIQRAIDMLPKNDVSYSNSYHSIVLMAGTYANTGFTWNSQSAYVHGFNNCKGVQFSKNGSDVVDMQCSFYCYDSMAVVKILGLSWSGTGYGNAISFTNCRNAIIDTCISTGAGGGFEFVNSNGRIVSCTVSNKVGTAITASDNSKVYSVSNNGSGNSVGLNATGGSVIAKNGVQPAGAESVSSGGVIR